MTARSARLATLDDIPELVRVINLAYRVEADMFHGVRTSEPDVRERLGRPNATFLALDDDAAWRGRLGRLHGRVNAGAERHETDRRQVVASSH